MNLAFVIQDFDIYGAENVALTHATSASAQGHSVTLFVLNGQRKNLNLLPDGVETVFLGAKLRIGLLAQLELIFKLAQGLRKRNIHFSISFLTFPNVVNVLSCWFNKVTKAVVTEHGIPNPLRTHYKTLRKLAQWTYPKSSLIVAVSYAVAAAISREFHLNVDSITVLPNPVRMFTNRESGRVLASVKNHILFLGRLDANKRPEIAIETLAHPSLDQFTLTIVGDGPSYPHLTNLAERLGISQRITFEGYQENIWEYFRRSSVLLHTSRVEGFGLVAIEAASAGVPIVSLADGGLPEIVPVYAYGTVLRNDATVNEIAEAIVAYQGQYEIDLDLLRPFFPSNSWLEVEKELGKFTCDT